MSTSVIAGFALGFSLILAIGAQNAFVLRQGLRREHRVDARDRGAGAPRGTGGLAAFVGGRSSKENAPGRPRGAVRFEMLGGLASAF